MRLGLGPGKSLKQKLGGGSTPASVPDLTPSAFTFTDVASVAVSTVQTSNSVTPTSYDTATVISITGGEYELDNSGVWTSSAGTISPGQSVRVRHTSSASGGTAVNTVLTIGGVSDTFTSTTLSGTITTPVITQTSAAGASPLLFTASLNTSDTYAGYIFRVQVAANTSSDFTTTSQDISHLLTESEITSGDIDITSNGFLTPSGAYSLRVRIEREDGVTSSWSNVLTGTITASVAKLDKNTVANRNTNLVFTNGDLTIKGNVSNGFMQFARATIARTVGAASEVDFTFTTAGSADGNIWFGLDDGTSDLSAYGQTYGEGVTNSTGIMARVNKGSNVLSTWRNSGTNVDYTMAANAAVSDVYSMKVNDSGAAGTHTIRWMRNGVLIATTSSLTITSYTRFLIGSSSDETLTVNFGAATQQDGGPIYG